MPRPGQPGGLSDELDPYVDRAEVERFDRMGELLRRQRPAPRRGLLERIVAGAETEAPANLAAHVTLALAVGLLLLVLAWLGASGSGPFGG